MLNKISNRVGSIVGPDIIGYYCYCYYYERLTGEQKVVYQNILFGLKALSLSIKLPLRPLNEVTKIFEAVLLDHPRIFYVSTFHYSIDLYKQSATFKPDYKYTRKLIYEGIEKMQECLQFFDQVKNKSVYEKEMIVHDYCLQHFQYDYTFEENSYSVYGLIQNDKGVCAAISKFTKLVLDYLLVNSIVVSGRAKNPAVQSSVSELHAWNIVELEGQHFHLDVTFDLTLKVKLNRYDYFNLADMDIKKDHIITIDVPECSTTGRDYFLLNELVASSPKELENIIWKRLQQGEKTMQVKLKNVQDKDSVTSKVLQIAYQQYMKVFSDSVSVNVTYNPGQLVFEIDFA